MYSALKNGRDVAEYNEGQEQRKKDGTKAITAQEYLWSSGAMQQYWVHPSCGVNISMYNGYNLQESPHKGR